MGFVSNSSRLAALEQPSFQPPNALFVIALLALGQFPVLLRYFRIRVSNVTPHPDVRFAWRPLAEEVFAGTPLYLGAATDNKPPLFELVNLAAYASDAYLLVLLVVTGLANAGIAIGLWRLFTTRQYKTLGQGAALLFLISAPLVNGHAINVRSMSVVFLVGSLLSQRPTIRGGACSVACRFSQHAVFSVPIVIYDGLQHRTQQNVYRWLRRLL